MSALSAPSESPAEPPADCFDQAGLPRQFGRYWLLRLLARGGMGQVFLGATIGMEGAERPVVIKVIRREHAKDPNFLARFMDEARVHAQLQHSGVAQVVEAATFAPTGDPFVVLEHVEGKSLGQVRRRLADVGARLKWEQAVSIGVLVAEALAYVHERRDATGEPLRIVHRDLSPHNVMVGYAGEVKIIDFGTARGQNRRCHTVAGVVFAKPGYVAPEVAQGDSGDFRVDLYAAGVMIWELCAGRRFLQGEAQEHMAKVAAGERDLPAIASAVGAPPELDDVLAKMTACDRSDRYATTRAAAAALGLLLRQAPPLSNGERGVRARVAQLMYNLYPSQPGRGRREFARLVAAARERGEAEWSPPAESPPASAPTEDPERLPGTRYRVVGELGRGASSIVYEAEHVDLGTRVAIKVLDAEHTHSQEFSARFRREARSLSRLHHPGLVRILDFGQASDGRLFCAMELCDGHDLREELVQADGPLRWTQVLRWARDVCLALAAAHRHGLVHRDIKPENLLLEPNGRIKLIDFSLAEKAGEGEAKKGDMGTLTLFGTPEYMAPEQVAGHAVDPRADLYALGCVMYEMLTGRLPFVASSAVEVIDKKCEGSPEPVHERAKSLGIPRAVSRLVSRAMARHARRRFEDAEAMVEAIDAALAEPVRRRQRRRTAGMGVVAAVMTVSVFMVMRVADPWLADLPQRLPWMQEDELPGAEPRPATTEPPPGPASQEPAPVGEESHRSASSLDPDVFVGPR